MSAHRNTVRPEDLKDFDALPTCVKCGQEENTDNQFGRRYCRTVIPDKVETFEYLVVVCPRCSFVWQMETGDADGRGNQ